MSSKYDFLESIRATHQEKQRAENCGDQLRQTMLRKPPPPPPKVISKETKPNITSSSEALRTSEAISPSRSLAATTLSSSSASPRTTQSVSEKPLSLAEEIQRVKLNKTPQASVSNGAPISIQPVIESPAAHSHIVITSSESLSLAITKYPQASGLSNPSVPPPDDSFAAPKYESQSVPIQPGGTVRTHEQVVEVSKPVTTTVPKSAAPPLKSKPSLNPTTTINHRKENFRFNAASKLPMPKSYLQYVVPGCTPTSATTTSAEKPATKAALNQSASNDKILPMPTESVPPVLSAVIQEPRELVPSMEFSVTHELQAPQHIVTSVVAGSPISEHTVSNNSQQRHAIETKSESVSSSPFKLKDRAYSSKAPPLPESYLQYIVPSRNHITSRSQTITKSAAAEKLEAKKLPFPTTYLQYIVPSRLSALEGTSYKSSKSNTLVATAEVSPEVANKVSEEPVTNEEAKAEVEFQPVAIINRSSEIFEISNENTIAKSQEAAEGQFEVEAERCAQLVFSKSASFNFTIFSLFASFSGYAPLSEVRTLYPTPSFPAMVATQNTFTRYFYGPFHILNVHNRRTNFIVYVFFKMSSDVIIHVLFAPVSMYLPAISKFLQPLQLISSQNRNHICFESQIAICQPITLVNHLLLSSRPVVRSIKIETLRLPFYRGIDIVPVTFKFIDVAQMMPAPYLVKLSPSKAFVEIGVFESADDETFEDAKSELTVPWKARIASLVKANVAVEQAPVVAFVEEFDATAETEESQVEFVTIEDKVMDWAVEQVPFLKLGESEVNAATDNSDVEVETEVLAKDDSQSEVSDSEAKAETAAIQMENDVGAVKGSLTEHVRNTIADFIAEEFSTDCVGNDNIIQSETMKLSDQVMRELETEPLKSYSTRMHSSLILDLAILPDLLNAPAPPRAPVPSYLEKTRFSNLSDTANTGRSDASALPSCRGDELATPATPIYSLGSSKSLLLNADSNDLTFHANNPLSRPKAPIPPTDFHKNRFSVPSEAPSSVPNSLPNTGRRSCGPSDVDGSEIETVLSNFEEVISANRLSKETKYSSPRDLALDMCNLYEDEEKDKEDVTMIDSPTKSSSKKGNEETSSYSHLIVKRISTFVKMDRRFFNSSSPNTSQKHLPPSSTKNNDTTSRYSLHIPVTNLLLDTDGIVAQDDFAYQCDHIRVVIEIPHDKISAEHVAKLLKIKQSSDRAKIILSDSSLTTVKSCISPRTSPAASPDAQSDQDTSSNLLDVPNATAAPKEPISSADIAAISVNHDSRDDNDLKSKSFTAPTSPAVSSASSSPQKFKGSNISSTGSMKSRLFPKLMQFWEKPSSSNQGLHE